MNSFKSACLVIVAFTLAKGLVTAQCVDPAGYTPLEACLADNNSALIGPDGKPGCHHVVVDKSYSKLGQITISAGGELIVTDKTLTLETEGIHVSGLLQIGCSRQPIGTTNSENKVTVIFTGNRCATPSPAQCTDPHHGEVDKGIEVRQGGELRLYGAKGTGETGESWTYLAAPAGPPDRYGVTKGVGAPVSSDGDRVIHVKDNVADGRNIHRWLPGDWIVIGTTSYSPFESEFVQIKSIDTEGSGSIITLEQPLVHYHFGGHDPGRPSAENYKAGPDKNYGIDERAEVGLISRNIKFTSTSSNANSIHWGGEIRILQGFEEATIEGVELEKFGKDQLGSYPIHFHMADEDGRQAKGHSHIRSNSIHHSYNKCITIHDTSGITVEDTVCARIVGHIFYQEMGTEKKISYRSNLGLGAMSNNFGITSPEAQREFWQGDNLATAIGYDGFNIPNTDNQFGPVHGGCARPLESGGLDIFDKTPDQIAQKKTCSDIDPRAVYFEPSSGFWITNPDTVLVNNSIGGCQGVGRGYWYLPTNENKFNRVGFFRNNRVHSCYSGLYAEPEYHVISQQLFPHDNDQQTGKDVFATFDGLTATRNRDRGIWMRPNWFVVTNARLAMNRSNASLLTAGGTEGTAPGNWALLKGAVMAGISMNNVDRFGPCPYPNHAGPSTGEISGINVGCADRTPAARDEVGKGYPTPKWNFSGFMIYDGPARIFDNRFVNFNDNINAFLTAEDQAYLGWYSVTHPFPDTNIPFAYEGDAALGWFQSNQSSYPPAQAVEKLIFENTNFRHQIYTSQVNLGPFNDGDKNTVVVDRDGSLTGFKVVDAQGNPVPDTFPISLNNLPFLAASKADGTPLSVNECQSTGLQDTIYEGRPTSLITPGYIATLQFSALHPASPCKLNCAPTDNACLANPPMERNCHEITFTKDSKDYNEHQSMKLHGRNFLGVYEPKVTSGYGYTLQSDMGIPKFITAGLTDAHTNDLQTNPFHNRVGICYRTKNGQTPKAESVKVMRGYKSYGQPSGNPETLRKYWNFLANCDGLDDANPKNVNGGCPADGFIYPENKTFKKAPLTPVNSIDELQPTADTYFYDATSGMLYFYVMQNVPNAHGPSPLGSCDTSDPANVCPQHTKESYYACPAEGCYLWTVSIDDPNYQPGPSACEPYPQYAQNPPANQNQLAILETGQSVYGIPSIGNPQIQPKSGEVFHHNKPSVAPACQSGDSRPAPPNPTWPVVPQDSRFATLTAVGNSAVTLNVIPESGGSTPSSQKVDERTTRILNLTIGRIYKFTATTPTGTSCTSHFRVSGSSSSPSFTADDDRPNGCHLPQSGSQFMGFNL